MCKNASPFSRDPIKQAKGNAAFIADKIKKLTNGNSYVTPVVCFSDAIIDEKIYSKEIDGVYICKPKLLPRFTTNRKTIYSKAEVAKLANLLSS